MSTGLCKEIILEAIDKLRSRKSRPDTFRICTMVSKKYNIPKHEVKEYLQKLATLGTVLRVEYKGSISYRNPKYFQRQSYTRPMEAVDAIVRDEISNFIAAQICKYPDSLENGVTVKELYHGLDVKTKRIVSLTQFRAILELGCDEGNFMKLENGRYSLGDLTDELEAFEPKFKPNILKHNSQSCQSSPATSSRTSSPHNSSENEHKVKIDDKIRVFSKLRNLVLPKPSPPASTPTTSLTPSTVDKEEPALSTSQSSIEESANGTQSVRSGRKRIQKIVFDPSDDTHTITKKKEKSVSPQIKKCSTPKVPPTKKTKLNFSEKVKTNEEKEVPKTSERESRLCFVCKSNIFSAKFLQCGHCKAKIHDKCFPRPEYFSSLKQIKYYCNSCGVCVKCQTNKQPMLVVCALCDDSFHARCVPVQKKQASTGSEWFCKTCSTVFDDNDGEIKLESESVSETYSQDEESNEKPKVKRIKTDKDESEVPDCSKWTCDEVYNYFLDYVTPEVASIFKDQEIDGEILLMLSRSDIVTDFKLKLGPALKIYAQVKKLKTRSTDVELTWQ